MEHYFIEQQTRTNLTMMRSRLASFLRSKSIIKDRSAPEGLSEILDLTEEEKNIINTVKKYTMTSIERQLSLCRILDYVIKARIEGDFVECGVWKGGSSMIAAFKLAFYKSHKKIWLYDTFEGMPMPDDGKDISYDDRCAKILLDRERNDKNSSIIWAIGSLEEVKTNLGKTGYATEKIIFVKGDIEQTIPSYNMPESICILRLDTDWYSSTYHELVHLYPLVSRGGFIIIDDYGHWQGAKKAVDHYLSSLNPLPYLHRIDYTCRVIQKPF